MTTRGTTESVVVPPGVIEADAPSTIRGEHDAKRYLRKRILRAGMRTLIKPLISWNPIEQPKEGYTILIGCTQRLVSMIWANLSMLDRCDMTGCDQVLIGIDSLPGELGIDLDAKAKQVAPHARHLPLDLLAEPEVFLKHLKEVVESRKASEPVEFRFNV